MTTIDARTALQRYRRWIWGIGQLLTLPICFVGWFCCSPAAEKPGVTEKPEPVRAVVVQGEVDECIARVGRSAFKGYVLIATTSQHPQGAGYLLTHDANRAYQRSPLPNARTCHITSQDILVRVLSELDEGAFVRCADKAAFDDPNGYTSQITEEEILLLRKLIKEAGGHLDEGLFRRGGL